MPKLWIVKASYTNQANKRAQMVSTPMEREQALAIYHEWNSVGIKAEIYEAKVKLRKAK